MSTRRKTAPKAPPAPPVVVPPCPPEWRAERRWDSYQHTSQRVHRVVAAIQSGEFHIPVFQRPYVWADAQIVRLLDSLVAGYHIGSLLCWERDRREVPDVARIAGLEFPVADDFDKVVVVDGQQRLGALALAFCSGRFGFDFRTRAFTVDADPHPEVIPLGTLLESLRPGGAVDLWWSSGAVEHAERKFFWLEEMLCCADVSIVQIPRRWPVERVIESYRRLATEGVPMAPEHLAEGLARLSDEVTP